MKKIKVLIVDDSALVRQVLTEIFNSDEGFDVVGTAQDPFIARDKIKQLKPDILTLDVEMPRMDGVTFLQNLMRLHPMPVVMISSLTEQGADITLQALESGAIDFVSKPKISVADGLEEYASEILNKVRMAASVNVSPISERIIKRNSSDTIKTVDPKLSADAVLSKATGARQFKTTDKIIAIGASTGGTEAIRDVLESMPADAPGIVISQHIPAAFSGPFSNRMNGISAMTVFEASDGQQILPGHVYIAPGSHHLIVERSGARYICRLNDGPPVNRHKPSVDVMFRSVAQNVGPNAIGVLLTGMGDDGARGLLELKENGAPTLIQDEKTSVVWGMPGEAAKLGAADDELPLQKIAQHLVSLAKN
ncbi:Chemotaxis response regulator protein-glutamate methylesterase CheB [hydrothermal vent metagenome]|uniref:protein-glutamate methylesterase n=1 Tax=hydrothermal vent metagenome TaxID=652676 RepID=A0A3B1BHG3_9ZZZZ